MELTSVERKVYGAMIINSDNEGRVSMNSTQIANAIGYKAMGGIITYAIKTLQFKNLISQTDKNEYMVFV